MNVGLRLLDFQRRFLEIINRELKTTSCQYLGSFAHEVERTVSKSFPSNILLKAISTHFSSSLDVVACQRYKQLNCTELINQASSVSLCSTHLDAANVALTTLEEAAVLIANFLQSNPS